MRSHQTLAGLSFCVLVFLALAAPRAWAAKTCQTPPGRSAIVEYCEFVPGEGSGAKRDVVPSKARRALRQAGPTGAAVIALAQEVPARGHLRSRPVPPGASLSGPTFALGHAGSSGSLLWLILVGIAVVLATAAWWRWRRRRRRLGTA